MGDYDAIYQRNLADPTTELGHQFDDWHAKLKEIAFTSASTYFKIHKAFSSAILRDTTALIERTIYEAITRGFTIGGVNDRGRVLPGREIITYGARDEQVANAFFRPGDPPNLAPRMAPEQARQISLSFAKTFSDNIKSQILNDLFPPDILQSALARARVPNII